MSLYIHKCHLVFLLRRKPEFGLDKDTQVPATWRWYLPSLCDADWHHYTVSVIDDEEDDGGDDNDGDRIIGGGDSTSSSSQEGDKDNDEVSEVFNSADNQIDDDAGSFIRVKRGKKNNKKSYNENNNENDNDKIDESKVSEEYLKFAKMFGKITSSSSSIPSSPSLSSPSFTSQTKAANRIKIGDDNKKESEKRNKNRKYNPRIDLYVDGKLFLEKPQSIVTDFPLHDVRKVIILSY